MSFADKRARIQALGKMGLTQGSILTDVVRLMFSAPLFFIPAIGPAMGWAVGAGIGVVSGIAFLITYKLVFNISFKERIGARVLAYLLGSGGPFGTTVATAITIALVGYDDAQYNKVVLNEAEKGNARTPTTSTPPSVDGISRV